MDTTETTSDRPTSRIYAANNGLGRTVIGIDSGDRDDVGTTEETWILTDVVVFTRYGEVAERYPRFGIYAARLAELKGDDPDLDVYAEAMADELQAAQDVLDEAITSRDAAALVALNVERARGEA